MAYELTEDLIPTAIFKLHGQHTVKVYVQYKGIEDKSRAVCDTCSLSQTAALAAIFAAKYGILKMTFDGADLKRI
jgi:hypothetical protein